MRTNSEAGPATTGPAQPDRPSSTLPAAVASTPTIPPGGISALVDNVVPLPPHQGYADVARAVLTSGLGSPLPLPRGRKSPPPKGWTGDGAPYASAADVEAWREADHDGNTALRLAPGVVGIDVDAHSGKPGAETMARLIGELGPLPPTYVLTARGFATTGDPSGIRLYGVPQGATASMRDVGPGVETIRPEHRYVVIAGTHPEGGVYRIYSGRSGSTVEGFPSLADLPELPAAWLAYLATPSGATHARGREALSWQGDAYAALDTAAQDRARRYCEGKLAGIMADARVLATLPEGATNAQLAPGTTWPTPLGWEGWLGLVLVPKMLQLEATPWTPYARGELVALLAGVADEIDDPRHASSWRALVVDKARDKVPFVRDSMGALLFPAERPTLEQLAGTRTAPQAAPVEPVSSGYGDQHAGQVRMAYRLALAYRGRLLYVHGIGWHYFDGRRWAEDRTGHAQRAVHDVLEQALIASLVEPELRKDVARCESAAGIAGVLQVASALVEFATTPDDLDHSPALLNVRNGTLDLDTMTLRPHDPADLLTKVTRAAYRPEARSVEWDTFLTQVMPDAEERGYLQRVIGQALYGRVEEHLLPLLIGTGANGKGVTYGAILHALGDYGAVVAPELLLTKRNEGIPTELMDLRGARLAVASETNEGRKLDEATMKRLTGGDPITARRLYRDPVTFTPTHTLLYVTNDAPEVRADAPAVWRRLRVIPFDVVVPTDRQDKHLPRRLEAQADAVLSWAVAGYADYRRRGMAEPARVLAATDDYKASVDPVRRFVTEACFTSPQATATTRQLYAAWQAWAQADDAPPISEKAFSGELARLGYSSGATRIGKVWTGLMPLAAEGV